MSKVMAYVWTWLALLVLLAANVALAFLDLGVFQAMARLAVPLVQVFLIVSVFMYRRAESALLKLASVAGFLVFFLLAGLSFNDYGTRPLDVALGRISYTIAGFQAANK